MAYEFNHYYEPVSYTHLCCVPGKKRLYVTATGEYKACERIGSSPSIGNVDEGVDRELIVKKYVEEFAAQSKDICDCLLYTSRCV